MLTETTFIKYMQITVSPDIYIRQNRCVLPNQELSEAKSELPGGTVGVCSLCRVRRPLIYYISGREI